jgi:NDP-sugar pyrophosphorylase family protein
MTKLFPVVILAGGLATRLHPVTKTIPKSLIELQGQAFITHQLRWLQREGVRHVILCVGFLGEQIEAIVGDGTDFGLHIDIIYDGEVLRGTGGALYAALPKISDNFFVLYGDSYLQCSFAAVQQQFIEARKLGLMTVFRNQGQWDTSNVEFVAGEIIRYDKVHRNPNMHYIDYGLGVFNKVVFASPPPSLPYDLALVYQALLKRNELAAVEVRERFYEIGSFAGIKELAYYLSTLHQA